MASESHAAPDSERYVLGSSEGERRRLTAQAAAYADATVEMLVSAGLAPGWRVLDVGTGVGDVAFECARLVGPAGAVLGIDFDPAQVEAASARASEQGIPNVTFAQGELTSLSTRGPAFDAVVGRAVLMHHPDPVAALAALKQFVRPGGAIAFHEVSWPLHLAEVEEPWHHWPHHPEFARLRRLILETSRAGGMQPMLGHRLAACYREAGLPEPTLRAHAFVARGAAALDVTVSTARSLLPKAIGLGVSQEGELDIDALDAELRAWPSLPDLVWTTPVSITAWARLPS